MSRKDTKTTRLSNKFSNFPAKVRIPAANILRHISRIKITVKKTFRASSIFLRDSAIPSHTPSGQISSYNKLFVSNVGQESKQYSLGVNLSLQNPFLLSSKSPDILPVLSTIEVRFHGDKGPVQVTFPA